MNNKEGILILGSKGMLGSMVAKVFRQAGIKFDELNHKDEGWDARVDAMDRFMEHEWIINCVGRIKPSIDENDQKSVWGTILVNSEFPYRLNETGAKVIQIATDCVYDGARGRYAEDDPHNATDVYGKTKSLGEVKSDHFYNIRCSIIGPGGEFDSLFEWFMKQKKGEHLQGYTNHMWNGVTTLQFARLCAGLVQNKMVVDPVNLQHFVPADTVMKSQLLKKLRCYWDRIDLKIAEVKAPQRCDRSLVTNNPDMNRVYWAIAGYKRVPTIDEMLIELNNFMEAE